MSGIFGAISNEVVDETKLRALAMHSRQRGRDSSSIVYYHNNGYKVSRSFNDIKQILKKEKWHDTNVIIGQSYQITNSALNHNPVVYDESLVMHDGIILNANTIWESQGMNRNLQDDCEVIAAIAHNHLEKGEEPEELPKAIWTLCQGAISAVLIFPSIGKLLLLSNNGSLYVGYHENDIYFSSEHFPLHRIECQKISQIKQEGILIDIPIGKVIDIVDDKQSKKGSPIPSFYNLLAEKSLLKYPQPDIRRCTKCILPETMPFISFDSEGVCNYCLNYKTRNNPKPKEELFELVKPYRRSDGPDCIVPFSGGRDSSYSLHLIVNELKMKPITYTYDWGMVTDLGHRNISRMCSELSVENIIIAADVPKKKRNIYKNLNAWLKSPHLGMISILTAGDKHFFQHIETVKKQTGINLNLWGANPLEVTYFKAGFLGIKPDLEEKRVYMPGLNNQMRYQTHRFKAMLHSPGYFNSSLWDTLTGEYYRSIAKKSDYYQVFDYWQWDEKGINETLISKYDWETAQDTNTTWRIGDGTAAFYNYIYYIVAGFTEHDTFRSNQIREGQITRDEALMLVKDENTPRYQNIRWYLDTLGMDFSEVISIINNIPKLYSQD